MNKKIPAFNFSVLFIYPIISLFSGIGVYDVVRYSGVDSYISIFFSFIFVMFFIVVFLTIYNFKEDFNLKRKISYLFGNFLGGIINLILTLLFTIIGASLLFNVSNFFINYFLPNTPIIIFMLLLFIVVIYNVYHGISNVCRVGIIFMYIIFIFTFIGILGLINYIDLNNFKPFLEYGLIKPFNGGLILTFINIIPIFSLLMVKKSDISDHNKLKRYIFLFISIGILIEFITLFLTIGALGINLTNFFQYPDYVVLKKISFFSFIERIENIFYIKWLFSSVMFLSLIVNYISKSYSCNSKLIFPSFIFIIFILFSLIFLKNTTYFYYFILKVLPFTNLFIFIIFFVIFLNIIIRKFLIKEK